MTAQATATTGTYAIRHAHPDEYDAVGQLTYEGFGHHLPGAHQPDQQRLELLLDAAARAREGVLLVAEELESGRLVGTASLLPFGSHLSRQAGEGEVELRLLAVLPEARRTGLGQRLMDEAARLATTRGAKRLILDTAVDNETSQRLYRRLGYVRQPDREKPRPAPKVQLVVYTLDLSED